MAILPYPVKALSVFRDKLYNVGWTESVYIATATDLKDAMTKLRQLETQRVTLLGAGVVHEYSSVSQDSDQLLGDVVAMDGLQSKGEGDQDYYNDDYAVLNTDFAWTAVLLRASAQQQYHRSVWLSGAPDDLTHDEDGRVTDKKWTANLQLYINVLKNGNFGIKAWSKDTTVSPLKTILNVDQAGNINVSEAVGLAVGDAVFVHAVHGTPRELRPHGQYQIKTIAAATAPATGSIITFTNYTPGATWQYLKGGYMRKRVQTVAIIDDAFQRAIKKKSRGRPLFLERGRSKTRCKC